MAIKPNSWLWTIFCHCPLLRVLRKHAPRWGLCLCLQCHLHVTWLTMAVPFSNTKLRPPRGFRNILEGLSREVLRCQPGDIYAFGSLYFDRLLRIRHGQIIKSSRWLLFMLNDNSQGPRGGEKDTPPLHFGVGTSVLLVLSCLVLTNDWQTSSWSRPITPMGGGGALRHATGASLAAGLYCSTTTAQQGAGSNHQPFWLQMNCEAQMKMLLLPKFALNPHFYPNSPHEYENKFMI